MSSEIITKGYEMDDIQLQSCAFWSLLEHYVNNNQLEMLTTQQIVTFSSYRAVDRFSISLMYSIEKEYQRRLSARTATIPRTNLTYVSCLKRSLAYAIVYVLLMLQKKYISIYL